MESSTESHRLQVLAEPHHPCLQLCHGEYPPTTLAGRLVRPARARTCLPLPFSRGIDTHFANSLPDNLLAWEKLEIPTFPRFTHFLLSYVCEMK